MGRDSVHAYINDVHGYAFVTSREFPRKFGSNKQDLSIKVADAMDQYLKLIQGSSLKSWKLLPWYNRVVNGSRNAIQRNKQKKNRKIFLLLPLYVTTVTVVIHSLKDICNTKS